MLFCVCKRLYGLNRLYWTTRELAKVGNGSLINVNEVIVALLLIDWQASWFVVFLAVYMLSDMSVCCVLHFIAVFSKDYCVIRLILALNYFIEHRPYLRDYEFYCLLTLTFSGRILRFCCVIYALF